MAKKKEFRTKKIRKFVAFIDRLLPKRRQLGDNESDALVYFYFIFYLFFIAAMLLAISLNIYEIFIR